MDTRDLGSKPGNTGIEMISHDEDFIALDEYRVEYHFAASPFAKSHLYLTERLVIDSDDLSPNRWHRFWQRVLLGWRWEKVKE